MFDIGFKVVIYGAAYGVNARRDGGRGGGDDTVQTIQGVPHSRREASDAPDAHAYTLAWPHVIHTHQCMGKQVLQLEGRVPFVDCGVVVHRHLQHDHVVCRNGWYRGIRYEPSAIMGVTFSLCALLGKRGEDNLHLFLVTIFATVILSLPTSNFVAGSTEEAIFVSVRSIGATWCIGILITALALHNADIPSNTLNNLALVGGQG